MTTPDERRSNQRDNQDFYSSKLSDTTRAMSYGLCAVSFTLLSTDTKFAQTVALTSAWWLLIIAGLGVLAIIADSLQMVLGWFASKRAAENKAGEYQVDAFGERIGFGRELCFYLKLVFAGSGAVALVLVLYFQIVH